MFLNIIKKIAALTAVMLLSALILPGPAAALESGGEHFSAYVAIRPIPEEVEEGTEVDLRLEGHETANMNYRIRWERGDEEGDWEPLEGRADHLKFIANEESAGWMYRAALEAVNGETEYSNVVSFTVRETKEKPETANGRTEAGGTPLREKTAAGGNRLQIKETSGNGASGDPSELPQKPGRTEAAAQNEIKDQFGKDDLPESGMMPQNRGTDDTAERPENAGQTVLRETGENPGSRETGGAGEPEAAKDDSAVTAVRPETAEPQEKAEEPAETAGRPAVTEQQEKTEETAAVPGWTETPVQQENTESTAETDEPVQTDPEFGSVAPDTVPGMLNQPESETVSETDLLSGGEEAQQTGDPGAQTAPAEIIRNAKEGRE